jgi:hypothetical protein
MLKSDIAVVAFTILSYVTLAISSPLFGIPISDFYINGQCIENDVFKTPPNFLPIISNTVCAEPPRTLATDGCDDVCVLTACCTNWTPKPKGSTATIQNGNIVDCSTVNCGNVCRLACDRQSSDEACVPDNNCGDLASDGRVFVFSRNGNCDAWNLAFFESPTPDPSSPTHVGFGFEVARDVFMFGSVENGGGCAIVEQGFDNGFWMTTGSIDQMLATFRNPPVSGFHGTIFPKNVANYDQYKESAVQTPNVCDAVRVAENLYSVGYTITRNNCLDAVYTVLLTYGVTFDPNDRNNWCPSGNSSTSFFGALTSGAAPPINNWSSAEPLPSTGSPVIAEIGCPQNISYPCALSTPSTATGLVTIPKISATSGPAACALCYIVGYFVDLNSSTLAYCSPPQPDYYVPAKYLVRMFCDTSVANIEPFMSLCSAACLYPCQQYSLDGVLQVQGTAIEPTWQNDFCGGLCDGAGDEGNCPVFDGQYETVCNGGLCPGADQGCNIDCTV